MLDHRLVADDGARLQPHNYLDLEVIQIIKPKL